jgi:hypothetical protein
MVGVLGMKITSLVDANVTLKDSAGAAIAHTFLAADANGVYTLTGTGFVNGLLDLNGVVSQTEASYRKHRSNCRYRYYNVKKTITRFCEAGRGNKTFEQFKKEFEDVWVSQFWNQRKDW